MTLLTIDAIRENPWNAVYDELPIDPDRLLLVIAFWAVDFCRLSEHELMYRVHDGTYTPEGYEPGPGIPDIHEEIEARWFAADRRLTVLVGLLGKPPD